VADRATGQAGQGLVEYGLILALSVAVATVTLVLLGGTVAEILDAIGDLIDSAT
jgi:Flp pilus assembly pilin Flp